MNNNEERSPLWGLTAGSAFAGGVGYGLYSNRNSISQALSFGGGEKILKQGASLASNTSPFFNPNTSSIGNIDSSLALMEDLNFAKENVKSAAYESLMSGGSITSRKALSSLSILNRQENSSSLLEAATSLVSVEGGDLSLFGRRINEQASDISARMSMLSESVKSTGNFSAGVFETARYSDLSEASQDRYKKTISNISAATEGKFDPQFSLLRRPDLINEKTVYSDVLQTTIGDKSFSLPLSSPGGFVYSGDRLQTRYIPRKAYNKSGEMIPYSDLAEETFINAIQKAKNQSQLKETLFEAHDKLIHNMWDNDKAQRAAALWSLPEPVLTSGGKATARLTMRQAVNAGMSEEDLFENIGNKLFPFTSPSAAGKGTMFTSNIATDLFGPLGQFVSPEQRPTQFIRQEWGATEASKRNASGFKGTFGQFYDRVKRKNIGSEYEKILYGNKSYLSEGAYSAPQLMTFYARPGEGSGVGYARDSLNELISAEEGVLSSSTGNMLEYERTIQKKISLDKGLNVNKQISEGLKGQEGFVQFQKKITGGAFIGIEKDTGRELSLLHEDAVRQTVVGAEVLNSNEANIYIKEKRRMKDNELWKFFSEENKYMLGRRGEGEFGQIASAAGLESTSVAGQQIEAIQSGKLVGRNKMALLNQQIEATSMFVSEKINKSELKLTDDVSQFLKNPTKFLKVSELLETHSRDADFLIQKNLVGLARDKWGFSQSELGLTFGLSSEDTFSRLVKEGSLREKEAYSISHSPGVVGLGKGMLGDMSQGKWGRGSFEQSGFRMLSMKGDEGLSYASELHGRLLGKENIIPLEKMQSSLIGQDSLVDKMRRSSAGNLSDLSGLPKTGGYYNIGKSIKEFGGSSSIYLPGVEEAPNLFKPIISGNKEIDSPIVSQIKGFRSALQTGEDALISSSATSLRNTISQFSEAEYAARGKIAGSQLLTGVRKTFKEDSDVFRISGKSADEMFRDLEDRSSSPAQKEFLKSQREALKKGETAVGGMWRHPTTGPESFQFVKYKVDSNLAEGIIHAPTRFGKIDIGGKVSKVDTSAMVGFAGDFDRDQYVLSAISDKSNADRVRRKIDNEMKDKYSKYLFNHYSMKNLVDNTMSKTEQLAYGSQEALQEGFQKLTTAKTTTGQVNLALQKLKIGLQYSAPEQYRPLSDLFFHMEQAAIGGKHGVLESELYQSIASATKGGEKGRQTMSNVLSSLFGSSEVNISGSLTDAAGNVTEHNFSANMDEMADVAISSYDAVSEDVDAAIRSTRIAKGKGMDNLSLEDITSAFNARRSGSVDISQRLMEGQLGRAENLEARASSALRKGSSLSRSLLTAAWKGKKYMMAGAGVAAAIGFLSPSTSGVIRPSGPTGGHAGTNPEDLNPMSGEMDVSPPPPGMNVSPRVYDMGGGQTSSSNVRMRLNDFESNSSNFLDSINSLGNTRLQMSDDRSILNPQSLANKIHERL